MGRLDGVSLMPVLKDATHTFRRPLHWRMNHGGQEAMRDGDWKYLKVDSNAAPETYGGDGRGAGSPQISVRSEIFKASLTSMPRHRMVDSSLECPRRSCAARRFFVRRWIGVAFALRIECVPQSARSSPSSSSQHPRTRTYYRVSRRSES